jgi:hypothetical protein
MNLYNFDQAHTAAPVRCFNVHLSAENFAKFREEIKDEDPNLKHRHSRKGYIISNESGLKIYLNRWLNDGTGYFDNADQSQPGHTEILCIYGDDALNALQILQKYASIEEVNIWQEEPPIIEI